MTVSRLPADSLFRLLVTAGMLVLAGSAGAGDSDIARHPGAWQHGQWFIDDVRDDTPQPGDQVLFGLRVVTENNRESRSHMVPLATLQGLSKADLAGDADKTVSFDVHRDAGTFHCHGTVHHSVGAGTYDLALDPGYARGLEQRGLRRPTENEQIELAFGDVGFDFLDELKAQRYPKPDLDQLITLSEHGVTTRYVHEMAEAGLRLGSLDQLEQARDHGITPNYVAAMKSAGFTNLTYAQLLTARDHGISSHYVAEMKDAGFDHLDIARLLEARDHGITPRYVSEMKDAGFDHLDLATLLNARDHGVTASYVRDLADNGYRHPSLSELVRARDHGVNGAWARKVHEKLGHDVTLDRLIMMRDRGEILEDDGR